MAQGDGRPPGGAGVVATTDGMSRPERRRVGLTPGAAMLLVAAVFAAFVLRDAFVAAHTAVGWVVACSVVALLLDPLVDAIDQALPRWLAVIVVLVALLSIVAGITIGLANDLLDSIDELREQAPVAAAGLEERYEWAADVGVRDRVASFVEDFEGRVRSDALSLASQTAPTYLVTGILMLFLLASGRRYFDSLVEQFGAPRRAGLRGVIGAAAYRGRRYLLCALAHSVVNGVVVGVVCWRLGLPAANVLGFAVGAFTILPLIGVLVGGVPALLLAFGLEGWRVGLVVLLALLALQVIEAAVVRPWVDARSVRVGPTVPIIVGLLGFELYGAVGAVYGIALAVLGLAALDAIGEQRA